MVSHRISNGRPSCPRFSKNATSCTLRVASRWSKGRGIIAMQSQPMEDAASAYAVTWPRYLTNRELVRKVSRPLTAEYGRILLPSNNMQHWLANTENFPMSVVDRMAHQHSFSSSSFSASSPWVEWLGMEDCRLNTEEPPCSSLFNTRSFHSSLPLASLLPFPCFALLCFALLSFLPSFLPLPGPTSSIHSLSPRARPAPSSSAAYCHTAQETTVHALHTRIREKHGSRKKRREKKQK